MTGLFWALIAFAGFAGWTVTLVMLMRNILPMANALSALGKLDSFIDDRIYKVVQRVELRKSGPKEIATKAPSERSEAYHDPLRDLFGGSPLEFGEQPESGMEVEA